MIKLQIVKKKPKMMFEMSLLNILFCIQEIKANHTKKIKKCDTTFNHIT
jgi:hypothetical protein